jgi:hypothetical protein
MRKWGLFLEDDSTQFVRSRWFPQVFEGTYEEADAQAREVFRTLGYSANEPDMGGYLLKEL